MELERRRIGVGDGWKEKTDVFIEAGGGRRDNNTVSIQIVLQTSKALFRFIITCYPTKPRSNHS